MNKLEAIKELFSVMNSVGVSLEDLNAYRKNKTETPASPEQDPSSRTKLPLEVLYDGDYRSFFVEKDKTPIAIICGNIGVAFEEAPKRMSWCDAEKYCDKYSVGGEKWSLPNYEARQLDLLYKNKKSINKVLTAFGKSPLKEEVWYWASETDGNWAWVLDFSDGSVYHVSYEYGSNFYVRPVILL